MKLNDLGKKDSAKIALKEHYSIEANFDKLSPVSANRMLMKVRKLINETKHSSNFHRSQHNPAYLKLLFMEQALVSRINSPTRIIVENEEVERSQIILAAQDMVDSVQKMYENVNDMIVKELPALVYSIQSEIGVNESAEYNSTVNEALGTLNTTLQETRTQLQNALNALTGQQVQQSGFDVDDIPDNEEDIDIGSEEEDDDMSIDLEQPKEPKLPSKMEKPEANLAGREKRI